MDTSVNELAALRIENAHLRCQLYDYLRQQAELDRVQAIDRARAEVGGSSGSLYNIGTRQFVEQAEKE